MHLKRNAVKRRWSKRFHKLVNIECLFNEAFETYVVVCSLLHNVVNGILKYYMKLTLRLSQAILKIQSKKTLD